jgi:hypothetical protein
MLSASADFFGFQDSQLNHKNPGTIGNLAMIISSVGNVRHEKKTNMN